MTFWARHDMFVCWMGGVLLTIRRCEHGGHARPKRHRGGQGAGLTTLRAAGDAWITAGINGIAHIHSYLHQCSIVSYDGDLNVKGQNLEVGKILKYDEISWFLDGKLIYGHYLRYLQIYVDYFTNFIEIRNFGAKTDFSNFGFFWREI